MRDATGKVIGVQGVFWDITERKRAEAALQKNQRQLAEVNQMLQVVMDTIPVRIFWKNKDLVYLGCNHLFAEDAGRKSPEDIVGETDSTWVGGSRRNDIARTTWKSCAPAMPS